MKRLLSISIRTKIILLVTIVLTVSLFSYLLIGTSLFIEDKTSYIYDYNLNQLKTASHIVQQELGKTESLAKLLGLQVNGPGKLNSNIGLVFSQNSKQAKIPGLVLMRPLHLESFQVEVTLGTMGSDALSIFQKASLRPTDFLSNPTQIRQALPGMVGYGGIVRDAIGEPLAFFALVPLSEKLLENEVGNDVEVRVYDTLRNNLFKKTSRSVSIQDKVADDFAVTLSTVSFSSGARDWTFNGKEYISGYQVLFEGQMLVTSYISRDLAFAATETLTQRSIALGLSILFVAGGITLVIASGLTRRLLELTRATGKIASGDFSSRVATKTWGTSDDEINKLAVSFNIMAEKVSNLLDETANKIRMEKELETAQAVQKLFFPQKDLVVPNLLLAGRCLPASECGGDWWNYAMVGRFGIVVLGDVTGHGVSAALITAAAHAAFTMVVRRFNESPEVVPSVEKVIGFLNSAVLGAAGGQSTMTLVAMVIDTKTGTVWSLNASHRPAYFLRKQVKALTSGRCEALGDKDQIKNLKPEVFKLQGGDAIFLYTDGLIEGRGGDKTTMISRPAMAKLLTQLGTKHIDNPRNITDLMIEESLKTMKNEKLEHPLEDDITFVTIQIPKMAKFVEAPLDFGIAGAAGTEPRTITDLAGVDSTKSETPQAEPANSESNKDSAA